MILTLSSMFPLLIIILPALQVEALMTAFASNVDYTHNCNNGDPLWNNKYFGFNMHPYEAMFQKANRDISPYELTKFTEWHNMMGYSSQKVCGSDRKQRWQLVDL